MNLRRVCPSLLSACLLSLPAFSADSSNGAGSHPSGCTTDATVVNDNDAGPGTLRAAVQDACAGGTIRFAERFVIALTSEISIDREITIDGSDVAGDASEAEPLVRIDGGQAVRVFAVGAAGHLTLRNLRVSNGIGDGGGVRNLGTLVVQGCRFDGHRGNSTSSLGGGAIFSNANATLLIEDSSFDGNGAGRGGAVFNSGDAEIYNSTFSGNIEGVGEGAIQNRGTLLGVHLTVTDNGRTDGNPVAGGLFAFGTNSVTTLVNSVFAGNRGRDCRISSGAFLSFGLMVQDPQNCPGTVAGDPLLQPLAANGGPTRTHAVGDDSAAIAAGDVELCLDTDQRGVARLVGSPCTLGAFEARGERIFADGFEPAAPPSPALTSKTR